jgi:hypothetical protein
MSERSTIEGKLLVPKEVMIVNGSLLSRGEQVPRPISPDMLQEFLEISVTRQESTLLRFARKYGPIGICEHNLPYGHNRRSYARVLNVMDCHPTPSSARGWQCSEPVRLWFEFACQAQAIVDCSARLHNGLTPALEGLEIANPQWSDLSKRLKNRLKPNRETSRAAIEGAINTWIYYGGLRPHFRWGSSGCSVLMSTGDYTSLFGALAAQLMLRAAMSKGWVLCSECSQFYPPDRQPNPNRRRFCPRCGLRAAWRASKRDQRRKPEEVLGG